MIQWQASFESGDIAWIAITSLISLILSVAGFLTAFGQRSQDRDTAFWRTLPVTSATLTVAWALWIYTLAFAPSHGTVPAEDPNPQPMRSLQEMMTIEDAKHDETHLYGRGGIIGNLDFLAMNQVTPASGTGEPQFSARRPNLHLPHILECAFRWSTFLLTMSMMYFVWSQQFSGLRLILFCVAWSSLVFAPVAHAVSGDGWLEQLGSLDFSVGLLFLAAGCSAVWCRSASAEIVEQTVSERQTACGVLLLWLGLSLHVSVFSFHPDGRAATALFNMILGSSAGFLTWIFCQSFLWKRPRHENAGPGMLASLATLAPGAGLMLPHSALAIGCAGAVAASIVFHLTCGASRQHSGRMLFSALGIGSFIGLMGTGIFATTSVGGHRWDGREISGLIQGNMDQITSQAIAAGATIAWSLGVTWVLSFVLRSRRVEPEHLPCP